jgi:hypothetical protein
MGFLTALADATPVSILVALMAFFAARSATLAPVPVALLAGVAVLVGATATSLRFQTEDRRFPLTWLVFDLLWIP